MNGLLGLDNRPILPYQKISSWNMIFRLFNILMIFVIKEKLIILTHILLAIPTNILMLLMTGFVVQSQIILYKKYLWETLD